MDELLLFIRSDSASISAGKKAPKQPETEILVTTVRFWKEIGLLPSSD